MTHGTQKIVKEDEVGQPKKEGTENQACVMLYKTVILARSAFY